jgi:hypothetical protein
MKNGESPQSRAQEWGDQWGQPAGPTGHRRAYRGDSRGDVHTTRGRVRYFWAVRCKAFNIQLSSLVTSLRKGGAAAGANVGSGIRRNKNRPAGLSVPVPVSVIADTRGAGGAEATCVVPLGGRCDRSRSSAHRIT